MIHPRYDLYVYVSAGDKCLSGFTYHPSQLTCAQITCVAKRDWKDFPKVGFYIYIGKPVMQEFLPDVVHKYMEKN